jgi:DNA-binding LacI/PurR family transcriptional regulator
MKPEPFPQRPSMVSHTAEVLRKGFVENRWGSGLPGERQLCIQIGVSRTTLRKAFEKLRAEGLIETSHGRISKPTKKASRAKKTSASRKVLVLSPDPLHSMAARALYIIDELRSVLAETGHRLEIRIFHPRPGQCEAAIDAIASAEPDAIWILYQQGMETHAGFHERKLPCIVFGTQNAGFPMPAVDIDRRATCRHAVSPLLSRGHSPERIALIVPTVTLPGDLEAIAGLREILGANGQVFEIAPSAASVPAAFDRMLARLHPPMALIFARSRHAVCALTHYSMVRGLRVPQDVSAICINDDPVFDSFRPEVSRYQQDNSGIARSLAALVLRVASGGAPGKKMTVFFPEFIPGQTVARH